MAAATGAKRRGRVDSDKDTVAAIQREKGLFPDASGNIAIPSSKDATTIHFSAKRELFVFRRNQHTFMMKEAQDDAKDQRPTKDPTYDVFRLECDIGVQAIRPAEDMGTQTPHYRKVHACIQAEPSVVDARLRPGEEAPTMAPEMKKFFERTMPRMLHHLTQSHEVPVFDDDYANLTEEDTFVGAREDSFLKEAGSFANNTYTKDKQITSVDWLSGTHQRIVCVSCIYPHSCEERIRRQMLVENSVAIVWNTADQMHPQVLLESPNEVLVLKFNPSQPNIVVGGCINGQVVMWDTKRAQDNRGGKSSKGRAPAPAAHGDDSDVTRIPPMPAPIKGHSLETDGDATVSRLQPAQISRVEFSHKRAVHDLVWLPDNLECSHDGRMSVSSDNHQFATISEDGYMFIWDLRPENLPQDKLWKLKRQGRVGNEDKPWMPLLKYQLTRPDGSGDILGLRMHLEGKVNGAPSYMMCCTTVEGEFCVVNFAPKDEKATQAAYTSEDTGRKEARLIRSISQAHAGPGWSIHRHPQLPDYYLTIGDWGFKIWKVGIPRPVVSSPQGEHLITCGRWSPTRASVIFIGTDNGYIQVWDLFDRSHEPVLRHQMIQEAITAIEFKPVSEKKSRAQTQVVCVGTKIGSFHLIELPGVLSKGHSNELKNMRTFLEREVRRVSYFQWRWKDRQKEMDRLVQDHGAEGAAVAAAPAIQPTKKPEEEDADEEDQDYMQDIEADNEFLAKVEKLDKEATEAASAPPVN